MPNPPDPALAPPPPTGYLLKMRVLVVEDDAKLAHLLAKGLRENAYAVDEVGDGEAALRFAAINEYDAVVLDLGLPRKSGLEVCRTLRQKESQVPILILTARDAVPDRVAGLDAGADDYLTKPFDFSELLARLRALLRRAPVVQPDQIVIDDLVIDTGSQQAARGDQPIELTAKEYALLEFLARRPGQVVGRAEITAHVWDENHDPASNTIEVYINRLRRKIDTDDRTPLIHTRRGAGYMLGSPSDA